MRRKESQIKEISEIEGIIRKATVCRIALCENDKPYLVPVCFGYADHTLYFHSAPEGKKLDILRKNNNVCFEMEIDTSAVENDKACAWSFRYKSVIGYGKALFVKDPALKQKALEIILSQYSNRKFEIPENELRKTEVLKVEIDEITGKKSGH